MISEKERALILETIIKGAQKFDDIEAKILDLANGKIKGQVTPMPSYFTGVPFGSFGSEHRS